MRRIMFASLAAAIALAGCGKSETDANGDGKITTEEAAKATAPVFPDPGLYKITGEIEQIAMPGMPAGMAEQMKKTMAANMTMEQCLTEADRADSVKKLAKGSGDGDCTYSKYDVSGGNVDAVMSCTPKGAPPLTYQMHGTITPTGVDMTMESSQAGTGDAEGMHMKMHVKSQRIGDCKS